MSNRRFKFVVPALLLGGVAMTAVAALPLPSAERPPAAAAAAAAVPTGDPYQTFNRQMFAFNAWLVRDLIEPTAAWLDWLLPQPVQQAGRNVYNNLIEPEFIVTNLFDGNMEGARTSATRFAINSTLGVGGLWDAGAWMGYERREVDFIASLCAAGLEPGNYLVLPAVGPANTYAAAMVTGFFAVEWYLLAFISSTLATADLVVDLSASAASLRYTRDVPGVQNPDPYQTQRDEFIQYLDMHCPNRVGARLGNI